LKVLVVGSGKVGSEIARDLARSSEVDSVIVADAQPKNLKNVRGHEKIRTRRLDISQRKPLLATMRSVDLICGALPGRLGFQLMTIAVEARRDIVDISYTPENPFKLHGKARDQGNIIVPQCGVAPGFTNMCVGDASRRLGTITKVRAFVGGLPQRPTPPLNYRIVFSLEDVINHRKWQGEDGRRSVRTWVPQLSRSWQIRVFHYRWAWISSEELSRGP
jgi:saccharopine dehydrogenase-like NADP-dependent oxidoreductase